MYCKCNSYLCLIVQVTTDCIFLETTIEFRIKDEEFNFQGKEILKAGFTRVYPFTVISNSEVIPEVTVNVSYPVSDVSTYAK